jgi:Ca-activated chloride channel family protein
MPLVPMPRRQFLALGGSALAAAATDAFATSPPPQWRGALIAIQGPGQPIELRAVTVRTTLAGGQARTDIEMRLFNPNPRVLEGELQFPLLEGQVVTGFALDVNGKLRDAVPVPKARGQEIFEDIRRRGVDPGLLEATAGNQYKLRIYPFMPHAERRIALTIAESLPRQGRDSLLRLPLVFGAVVGSLAVTVQAPSAQPGDVHLLGAPEGTRSAVDPQGGMTVTLTRQRWEAPQGTAAWLRIGLREPDRPQLMLGATGGSRYFAGHIPVRDEPVRRPDPRHVALVWDASGSAAQQARVLPLLDQYFRSLARPVQVSLLVVRNRAQPARTFTIAPDGFAELAQALRAEPRDGSSNFDELPVPADADLVLMVTDGLMTDGRREIGYRHTAPVLAINGATAADAARLTRLADRSGGAYVDATLPPARALRAMQFHGWRIERLQSVAAEQLVAPVRRVQDGRIAIAGVLVDDAGTVEVALAHPDGRRRVLRTELPKRATAGHWPGQLWAQWRSAELGDRASAHAEELKRIAAEHGIVGPNSSLIVLEFAADYARYELPAPPELAAEVAQLRQQGLVQARQSRQAHLAQVVRQFEERQRWWDRDFPLDAPQRRSEADSQLGALGRFERNLQDGTVVMSPPAMAESRAAPMPRPAPAAAGAPLAAQKSLAARDHAAEPVARQDTIGLRGWTPDAHDLRRLLDAPPGELYAAYLDEREQNAASSAFFMDAAGLLFDRGQDELALRVLSNLAEMNLENRQLLRLYAHRLVQARRDALAVPVFERVTGLAPNEPQSWRDLGLALAQTGQPQRAVDMLWEVVSRPWHGRFAGAPMIALAELNAIAAQAEQAGRPLDVARIDPRLRRNLPLGLRVVLCWDTDDTDLDLLVTDPNGETASPWQRLTSQGGATSPNATGGYGPEEFAIKRPKPGKYLVQARFAGHRQQVLTGATTAMLRVTTGFGTPAARDEWITLRLDHAGVLRAGEVEVR